MNLATILIAIPVAALLIWALVKTIKNRGKCSGCSGTCPECQFRTRSKIDIEDKKGQSDTR